MFELQRLAGNRAVTGLLSAVSTLPTSAGPAGGPAVQRLVGPRLLWLQAQGGLTQSVADLSQLWDTDPSLSRANIRTMGRVHAGIGGPGLIHLAQNRPATRTLKQVVTFANNLQQLTPQQVIQILAAHPLRTLAGCLSASVSSVCTPQDNFAQRSKSRIGVGEQVDLTVNINPGGITAAQLGGLQWVVSAGHVAVGASNPAAGTATAQTNGAPGRIRLDCNIGAGGFAGTRVTRKTRRSIPPTKVRITNAGTTDQAVSPPHARAAFTGQPYLRPRKVSFSGVQVSEGAVGARGSGYFKADTGTQHAASGAAVGVGPGNANTGSRMTGTDNIATNSNLPPFKAGRFFWPIPWSYQAPGVALKKFTVVTHEEQMFKNGRVRIRKGGSGWVSNF
jgi:hypothetical protein